MADQVEEFEYTIAGRTMRFRYPHSGQLIMLKRMQQRALRFVEQTDELPEGREVPKEYIEQISAINLQTLELIESLFLDPKDLRFVEQQMLTGVLDLPDLMPILAGGKARTAPPDDDEDPVTAPVVLKNKKPAATAKVAAKKATTRRGTR